MEFLLAEHWVDIFAALWCLRTLLLNILTTWHLVYRTHKAVKTDFYQWIMGKRTKKKKKRHFQL